MSIAEGITESGLAEDKKVKEKPLPVAESVSRSDMLAGVINGRTQAFLIGVLAKEIGKDGLPGKDGADGADGADGIDAKPGRDGKDGEDGKDGIDGKDGGHGLDGNHGRDGGDGLDGQPGPAGLPSKPGRDGSPGVDGKPGADGHPGETGQRGLIGNMGPPGFNGDPGKEGPRGHPGDMGLPGMDGSQYRPMGVGYIAGAITQKMGGIVAPTIIDWDTFTTIDTACFIRSRKRIHVIEDGVYSIEGHFGVTGPKTYKGRLGLALNGSEVTDQGYGSYPFIRQNGCLLTTFRWIVSLNKTDSVAIFLSEETGSTSKLTALTGLCHIRVTRL